MWSLIISRTRQKCWEVRPPLSTEMFLKNKFSGVWEFSPNEKRKKWILEINRKYPNCHSKPSLGCFGGKVKAQHNLQVKNRKYGNQLDPSSNIRCHKWLLNSYCRSEIAPTRLLIIVFWDSDSSLYGVSNRFVISTTPLRYLRDILLSFFSIQSVPA